MKKIITTTLIAALAAPVTASAFGYPGGINRMSSLDLCIAWRLGSHHDCNMKYNQAYRNAYHEKQRIEAEERRRAEERRKAEERRRAAEERKRANSAEAERRAQRAQEWSDYQDRQRESGGWVDPCRVGGC